VPLHQGKRSAAVHLISHRPVDGFPLMLLSTSTLWSILGVDELHAEELGKPLSPCSSKVSKFITRGFSGRWDGT
jgi:hypothetical protein